MRYAALGTIIKQARIEAGLRQSDLAERVHICTKYVSFIERGRQRPSATVAQLIERVLDVDLREHWESVPMVRPREWV